MKTLLYLTALLACAITPSLAAADPMEEARQQLRDAAVHFEVLADLSDDCKIDIKVYGTAKGIKGESCGEMIAYAKDPNTSVDFTPPKGLDPKTPLAEIAGDDPLLRATVIRLNIFSENGAYIMQRVNTLKTAP